jgi:glycosyltransferase involved in cell wall biosynthesis
MRYTHSFTVFTPTYNRAHTIKRVYDSLRAQTRQDFEWLIVDDGSTDGTSAMVAEWIKSAEITIRYVKQEKSGRHVAYNRALREASGQLFLPMDSDDAFTCDALAKVARHWSDISENDKAQFAGIGGLCRDQFGELVGDLYPAEPFDVDMRELEYRYKIRGEKWVALATDIARLYPFPEVANTQFVPEGVVWFDIAKRYKIRWFNEVYRIYYVNDFETGSTLSDRPNFSVNAPGFTYYYTWLLNNTLEFFFQTPAPFLRAAVMLPIVARYSGMRFGKVLCALHSTAARLLVVAVLPLSTSILLIDATRRRRSV